MNNMNIEKYVTANMSERMKKAKTARVFTILLAPLAFIMFGLGGYLCTVSLYCIPIPIIGFCLFPTAILTSVAISSKIMYIRWLLSIVDNVKAQDKVFLYQINASPSQELQTVSIVKKLIDTGYLEGYELVGSIMVAKETLHITEEAALREYTLLRFGKLPEADVIAATNNTYAPFGEVNALDNSEKECYYCHAMVAKDAIYCSKCGARLDY